MQKIGFDFLNLGGQIQPIQQNSNKTRFILNRSYLIGYSKYFYILCLYIILNIKNIHNKVIINHLFLYNIKYCKHRTAQYN